MLISVLKSKISYATVTGKDLFYVGSITIVLNGPAARKCEIGDQLFIITYAQIDPTKKNIKPKLVDLKTGE